jgi:dTMP kinase
VSEQAPFIPPSPEQQPVPRTAWRVFGTPEFFRLWLAQVVSSLGDWIGLVAILALAASVSSSGTAVGLVMVARMLPGFLLAPVGGALVDRWNRRTVMVTCDLGRAALLVVLPFLDTLAGLVVISFLIEVLTLLWGPAKDATVPNVVRDKDQLASANSLGLVAAYATFPLGAVVFALLAGVATWMGDFKTLDWFDVNQESLAIWVDALTFLCSALIISRLAIPEGEREPVRKPDVGRTGRDVLDGLRFIRSEPLVRGVMIGLAGGLLGGGAIVPLGPVFVRVVLGGDSPSFGLLMTALGTGAALGVVALLWLQRRLPREKVFVGSIFATGAGIMVVASVATLTPAFALTVFVGAAAGCGYVTGFTLLQESVSDEMRGRIFGTLYTIVRLCLLLSLTIGPFVASALGAISDAAFDGAVEIGGFSVALTGVRLALWLGGAVTMLAAVFARRRMRRARAEGSLGGAPA